MASIPLKWTHHKANPLQPLVKAQQPQTAWSDPVVSQRSKRDEYKVTSLIPWVFFTNNIYYECQNINIHSSLSATCSQQTQALPPLLQSNQGLLPHFLPTRKRLNEEDPHRLSFQAGGTSEFSAVPGFMINKHAALNTELCATVTLC